MVGMQRCGYLGEVSVVVVAIVGHLTFTTPTWSRVEARNNGDGDGDADDEKFRAEHAKSGSNFLRFIADAAWRPHNALAGPALIDKVTCVV